MSYGIRRRLCARGICHHRTQRGLSQGVAIVEAPVRRALVNRFPYGVLYVDDHSELLIVAIMHLHREPGYWESRVT